VKTSERHTLRKWSIEVVDITLWSLPGALLGDGKTEAELDNVILAFCGHCGCGTIILDPDEWFSSRKRILRLTSNRDFISRSCTYCFKACQAPSRSVYDRLVAAGSSG
jgi:hypothetical protein